MPSEYALVLEALVALVPLLNARLWAIDHLDLPTISLHVVIRNEVRLGSLNPRQDVLLLLRTLEQKHLRGLSLLLLLERLDSKSIDTGGRTINSSPFVRVHRCGHI